jgi:hypothetical protein
MLGINAKIFVTLLFFSSLRISIDSGARPGLAPPVARIHQGGGFRPGSRFIPDHAFTTALICFRRLHNDSAALHRLRRQSG